VDSEQDQDQLSRDRATLVFANVDEMNRVIAGLPAAARHVRALAEAGFAEALLVCPAPDALARRTEIEVERLRGTMQVRRATAPALDSALVIPGLELHPVEALNAWPGEELNGNALQLDHPGASDALLRASGKPSDGLVSRWLNRPISRRISAILLRFPAVRPIHATIATALLAAAMFAALVLGGAAGAIAGGLLFHAASVIDGVDGEIARATHRTSAFGAAVDSAVDMAANILFVLGMTVNLWLRDGAGIGRVGVWGLALFALGLTIIFARSRREREEPGFDLLKQRYRLRYRTGFVPFLIGFVTAVTSRDFFAFLFMVMILAGLEHGVLWVFAGAATVWILLVLATPGRAVRRFSPAGEQPA
jgi:CDP-L-myo-inositol myo-inositolphosphotransferase